MADKKTDPLRIKKITESIIGLPTLPTVVSKMIQLVDNPRTSAASLAKLISSDQALTARILKLANSAYYGFPREISTVNMAIVVLGFNTVKDMGLSLSVFDAFKNIKGTGNFDVSRFWQHSIACGIASRMLTRSHRTRYAGEAFVAGLLHDIGKVILNQYFHDEFMEIIRLASSGTEFDIAELEVIGTGHAQIGAWLAEKWNLPKIISSAILYHHNPWDSSDERLFNAIITLSDYLCHVSDYSYSGRSSPPMLQASMWEIFQKDNIPVDEPDIENLLAEFQAEFDNSETFVNLLQENN